MVDENLMKYLKNNPDIEKEDKNYIYNFYSKLAYIKEIYGRNPLLEKSSGNYNAKVFFSFESLEEKEKILPLLKPLLEEMNVSIWNVYITTVTDQIFLCNEINAVAPKIVYFFHKEQFEELSFDSYPRAKAAKIYYITTQDFTKEENDTISKLKYINFYKELEVKE